MKKNRDKLPCEEDEISPSISFILKEDQIELHKHVLSVLTYIRQPENIRESNVTIARIKNAETCCSQCNHGYCIGNYCYCTFDEKINELRKSYEPEEL